MDITQLVIAAQAGDQSALSQLLESCEGICQAVIKKYVSRGSDRHDDYLQEARLGILVSIPQFDPEGGQAFQSYAWDRARWACYKWARQSSPIRVPESTFRAYTRLHKQVEEGERPTGAYVQCRSALYPLSLDNGEVHEIASPGATEPGVYQMLRDAVAGLPPREQTIISQRYLEQDTTESLQLSTERIRQLEHAGLRRLGAALFEQGYRPTARK